MRIILSLALFASPLFAWLEGNIASENIPPQSCMLIMREAGQPASTPLNQVKYQACSATIIDKKELLTSAHCFLMAEVETPVLRCPGMEQVRIKKKVLSDRFSLSANKKILCAQNPYDLAVVEVEKDLPHKPILLPQSEREANAILANANHCRVFGWGKNKQGMLGESNGYEFQPQPWPASSSSWVNQCGVIRIPGAPVVQIGDSGGATLCKNQRGEEVLLGVTSSQGKAVYLGSSLSEIRKLQNLIKQDHISRPDLNSH